MDDIKRITFTLLFWLTFAAWVFVLPIRSVIYVLRIIREFSGPIEKYYQEIVPCKKELNLDTLEKQRIYHYRSLGVECED